MPLVPSLGPYIPGTPASFNVVDENQVLSKGDFPSIYTTSGPLPVENGLAMTTTAFVFDPSQVTEGDLDCGVFGSQA